MLAWDQNSVLQSAQKVQILYLCAQHISEVSKDYNELLKLIVCDRNSKECMIHCFESCPAAKADDDGQVDDYNVCWNLFPAVDHQWQGWTDLLHASTWWIHWSVSN